MMPCSFVFLINIVRYLMFSWQDSNPRIIKFGEYPGGPCGGTHVADISIINSLKVIIIFWCYPNVSQAYQNPVQN